MIRLPTKKTISFLVILALFFNIISLDVMHTKAATITNIRDYFTYPNETEYEITDADGIYALSLLVNDYDVPFTGRTIILANDLDLGSASNNLVPIGFYESNPFSGTFEGNNYTISGININTTSAYQALFGYIENGTVQNLTINNSTITGSVSVGSICGLNVGGTIKNCYNYATLSSTNIVGGIAGENSGTITNCYNFANLNSNSVLLGGIVGKNQGTISICYNNGSITNGSNAASTAGITAENTALVENCYNIGSINGGGGSNAGGITGAHGTDTSQTGTLENCYNVGTVTNATNLGSVIGVNISSFPIPSIINCYYLQGSASKGIGLDQTGSAVVYEKTSAEMKTDAFAYNLNTTNSTTTNSGIWTRSNSINNGYPTFTSSTLGAMYQLTIVPGSNGTISYNGVSNGVTYATAGSTVSLQVTPTTGYSLTDLIINGTTTANTSGSFTMPAENTTVQPVFDIANYTITATLNGGTLNSGVTIPTSYTINSNTITLPTASQITRTGYTFEGWYTTPTFESGTTITEIPQGSTGNVNIYAKWSAPIEYTITANLNNGTLDNGVTIPTSYNVTSSTIVLPTDTQIVRTGYAFEGWFTTPNFQAGTQITSIPTGSTGNVNIYAKWSNAIQYTISTNLNGGNLATGVTIPSSYNVNTPTITLPNANEISRPGYAFAGWYTNSSFSGNAITEIPQGSTGNIAIYAKWVIVQYSITANLNGGNLESGITIPSSYNVTTPTITLPTESEVTRPGFDFEGWYTNPDFTGNNITSILQGSTGNVTLYAKWSAPIGYTITTYLNGGTLDSGVSIPTSYDVDTPTIILPTINEISRPGYTFEGWYTNSSFSGTAITEIPQGSTGDINLFAKWSAPITYSITTELNGGTLNSGVSIPTSYNVNTPTITLPTINQVSRTGYTFEGWYTNSSFSGTAITEIPQGSTGDITLYAKWSEPITYRIVAQLNSGTLNSGVSIPTSYNVTTSTITLPTANEISRTGYAFGGWYTSSDFTGSAITQIPEGSTGDITIYAKWVIVQYTITTNLNGGTLATGVSIPDSYTITTPTIALPTINQVFRAGFNFEGWYTNPDFNGSAITQIPQGSTGNISLYAKWSNPIGYTITTYLNGGTLASGVSIPTSYDVLETPIILPTANEISRPGYSFEGWFLNSSFTGNAITEIPAGTTGDINLFARWSRPINYTITSNLNGGTLASGITIPTSYTVNTATITLPTNSEISREGFTFGGWYTSPDFSANPITEIPQGSTGNITIYAKWDIITYSITTTLNGGTLDTGISIPTSYTVDTPTIILPTGNNITRAGFNFEGWYTNPDFNGNAIYEIPIGSTGDINLYAKWSNPIGYTITTYLNGGTLEQGVSIPDSYTILQTPLVLPTADEISRPGYNFEGWFLNSSFSGNAITEIPAGTTGDINLFAKWSSPIEYSITTTLNGGTLATGVSIPTFYNVTSDTIILPNSTEISRSGFDFEGWYTNPDFTGNAIVEIPTGSTGDINLYAKWSNPIGYTITTYLNGGTLASGISIPDSYTILETPLILPTESEISRTGYSFEGWFLNSSFSGNAITEIPAGTTGDINLFAKWTPIEYTIATHLNGGTLAQGVSIPSSYNITDTPIVLPGTNEISRDGYAFAGWFTNASFSGSAINEIPSGSASNINLYAKWVTVEYSIITTLNGGTLATGITIPTSYNVTTPTIVLPTAGEISRPDFNFEGWYSNPDFVGDRILEIPTGSTGNVTLYAKWSMPIGYTITSYLNGGTLQSGITIPESYITSETPIQLPTSTEIIRPGYNFEGWFTNSIFSGSPISEIPVGSTGDISLFAKWSDPIDYNIITILNGGSLKEGVTIPTSYNVTTETISLPTASEVSRRGYIFGGWFTNPAFLGEATTEIPTGSTGNITLYAKWTIENYPITATLNGGTLNEGITIPTSYNINSQTIVLPTASEVSRSNFNFDGWFTNPDFTGNPITKIPSGSTGNVTLYAKWSNPIAFTITTYLNGGTLNEGVTIPKTYITTDTPIDLPTTSQISRIGYTFDGWFTNSDFSGDAITEIPAGSTGDINLFAKWSASEYKITTNLNGGTLNEGVTIPETYITTDTPIVLPTANEVSRIGYTFDGWFTTSDFSGNAITEIPAGSTGDINLFAKWKKTSTPVNPSKPIKPTNPIISSNSSKITSITKIFKTGDNSYLYVYVLLGTISLGTSLIIGRRISYKKKQNK